MRTASVVFKLRRCLAAVCTVIFLVSSCAFVRSGVAQTSAPLAASSTVQEDPTKGLLPISPGDLLDIRVFDTPQLSGRYRVSQTGFISLPQGQPVHVAGVSAAEAGVKLEQELLSDQVLLAPRVTVFVEEYASQGVIVLGEVTRPGAYTLLGEHTLYGALAAAGGVTPNAGSTITVTQPGATPQNLVIQVTSPNFSEVQRSTPVSPGATVFVSRTDVVYVVGDVTQPGEYTMPNGVPRNLLQILALSQGLRITAAASKASIVRTVSGTPQTIPVDIHKVIIGEAPDLTLQPSDILVVPRSGAKTFLNAVIPNATSATLSAVVAGLVVR